MRILHTIDSIGIYGAETVLLNLACEQQHRGHEPIILSIGNPGSTEKPLEAEAVRRGLQCIRHRMRDGLNLPGARLLLEIAGQQRADVVHSHGYKSNILLGVLPRFMRKQPVVTTLHGWTAKQAFSRLGLYRFLDQRLLSRLDAIVVVNEQLKNSPVIKALDQSKIHAIPNGIKIEPVPKLINPMDDSLAREILEFRRTNSILIGAVGRLSPEKNFAALMEALRQSRTTDVGAVVLGDGPEAGSLRQLISAQGLSQRVLLGGFATDARKYLPLFDLLVIPSLTEGLPMILLEAMSANLPVIATSVGDIPATLGGLGVLVKPGSVAELASAISAMTSGLAHYRIKASGGSQRVLEHYSAATMTDRYESVYRSVLG